MEYSVNKSNVLLKLHITYLVTMYSLEKELDLCKHYQGIELIRLNWTI